MSILIKTLIRMGLLKDDPRLSLDPRINGDHLLLLWISA